MANLTIKVDEKEENMKEGLKEEKMFEKNILRNHDHLRKIANDEVSQCIGKDNMDI